MGEKAEFFREGFTRAGAAFLTFDHRGHGASSGTMRDLTVTRNLEDLEAVLAAAGSGFKRLVLIGSSMGGQTAAWYAARHPDRVGANLLIAPGFRFLEHRVRDLGPEGLDRLESVGETAVRNEWVDVTIGRALLEDGRRYLMESLLASYRTPTLIIHGAEDDTVPIEDSLEFIRRSSARPLELRVIDGGDHRLTEHKETLFTAMRGFLRGLGIEL